MDIITDIVNAMADCDDAEAREAFDADAMARISEDELRRLVEEEPERMHEIMSVAMKWKHKKLSHSQRTPKTVATIQ